MKTEPNKFEQDLRDKLNAREIMPSEKAWDRLDAMLAVTEEKKSKRNYGWLYVAAAVLGFLFIGTVFFSQTEILIDKGHDNMVLENANKESVQNDKETLPTVSVTDHIAAAEPKIKTETQHQNQSTNQSSIKNQIKNQNPVEAVNPVPANQELIASNQSTVGEPADNHKLDRPAVKVDELLAAAQNQQVNPKTSVKVNAKNLLSEVDQQVNRTFREKMMRRASEVAETVANRNNE